MNIYKRLMLLVVMTIAAAAGAAFAKRTHHRRRHAERELEHGSNLKAWENEGGNLAPAVAVAPPLAVHI